jgi:hypothetical protein
MQDQSHEVGLTGCASEAEIVARMPAVPWSKTAFHTWVICRGAFPAIELLLLVR